MIVSGNRGSSSCGVVAAVVVMVMVMAQVDVAA